MKDSISASELRQLLDEGANIKVYDVRRQEDRVDVAHPVPGAQWRDPEKVTEWSAEIGQTDEAIVFCVKGAHVCQTARSELAQRGINARFLEGGVRAWCEFVEGQGKKAQ